MKARWKFLDIKTDKRQIDMGRLMHLQRSGAEREPSLDESLPVQCPEPWCTISNNGSFI